MRESMERSGAELFRWRSYLPALILPFALPAVANYEYPWGSEAYAWTWDAVCLVVSLLGFAVRVATVGQTPSGTSGRNTRRQKADVLNTTGVYSTTRNPLYLGNFLIGLGVAMFPFSIYPPILYALFFHLYYERIILAEEKFLREKFGREYDEWAESTPVFIPKLADYEPPATPFSWKRVARRENTTLMGIALAMTGMEMATDLKLDPRHWELDTPWAAFLGASVALWAVARFLKKRTRFLRD